MIQNFSLELFRLLVRPSNSYTNYKKLVKTTYFRFAHYHMAQPDLYHFQIENQKYFLI